MKRRDFLVSSAVLPIAAAVPSWAVGKVVEPQARPSLDATANYRRNVTILGTSRGEWRSAYVVDLYRRSNTLYDTRAAWDILGGGPSVAFGTKAFHNDIMKARPGRGCYLVFHGFDMTSKEGAVYSAMRCNAPLVLLEDLDPPEPIIPSYLLPKMFLSGIHVAGGITAPTTEKLFEKIAPRLGVWGDFHESYAWAGTLEGGRSKVQVFYDGENVTDGYIDWLTRTLSPPLV
jgi:hypothetical protein